MELLTYLGHKMGQSYIDEIIIDELLDCHIIVVHNDERKDNGIIETHISGKLNNFSFERYKNMWKIEGYLPIEYAIDIYENHKDLVLDFTNETDDNPLKWKVTKELDEYMKGSEINDIVRKYNFYWEHLYEPSHKLYIRSFTTSTKDGLIFITNLIKDNNIQG